MSLTLDEVAEKTGLSQAHLRKLIQRGQLGSEKDGSRTVVPDRALVDFLAARALDDAADAIRLGDYDEALRVIRGIPDEVRSLILQVAPARMPNLERNLAKVAASPVRAVPKPSQKKR